MYYVSPRSHRKVGAFFISHLHHTRVTENDKRALRRSERLSFRPVPWPSLISVKGIFYRPATIALIAAFTADKVV